jgi:hypothetical protein
VFIFSIPAAAKIRRCRRRRKVDAMLIAEIKDFGTPTPPSPSFSVSMKVGFGSTAA